MCTCLWPKASECRYFANKLLIELKLFLSTAIDILLCKLMVDFTAFNPQISTSTTKWPPSFDWLFCHCIWCAIAYSKSPKITNKVCAIPKKLQVQIKTLDLKLIHVVVTWTRQDFLRWSLGRVGCSSLESFLDRRTLSWWWSYMMVSGKSGRWCAWRVYQVVSVYCQHQFSLRRLQLYIGGLIWPPFFSPLVLAISVIGALFLLMKCCGICLWRT